MALLQKGYLGSTALWKNKDWFEATSPQVIDYVGSAVTVTANTAAHTKGSWSQLVASTSANSSLLFFEIINVATSGANTATLLDIATGASGSETAIVSNLAIGGAFGALIAFPYKLASGTRLSARIQSVVTGGKTAQVRVVALDAGDYATAPTSLDVIGGDTATSQGISFSGASGTWTQATSSTSRAYRGVSVVLSCHDATIATLTNGQFELGIGASGSEINFGDARHSFTTSEASSTSLPYNLLIFGRTIASGSRLAVKHPIAANPERYGFNLIGIP